MALSQQQRAKYQKSSFAAATKRTSSTHRRRKQPVPFRTRAVKLEVPCKIWFRRILFSLRNESALRRHRTAGRSVTTVALRASLARPDSSESPACVPELGSSIAGACASEAIRRAQQASFNHTQSVRWLLAHLSCRPRISQSRCSNGLTSTKSKLLEYRAFHHDA